MLARFNFHVCVSIAGLAFSVATRTAVQVAVD